MPRHPAWWTLNYGTEKALDFGVRQLREARASWQRRIASERGLSGRRALVLSRKAGSTP